MCVRTSFFGIHWLPLRAQQSAFVRKLITKTGLWAIRPAERRRDPTLAAVGNDTQTFLSALGRMWGRRGAAELLL